MKYFWLVPKGQRHNNFILFHDADGSRPVTLRERYLDLQCKRCKKLDADVALQRGLEAGISIRARTDYVACDYGLVAVSKRFRGLLREHSIGGITFAELPSDDNYAVVMPDIVADTDIETCGMELHRRCDACGRYRETCFLPAITSMQLPDRDSVIFSSSVPPENTRTSSSWFLAAKSVVDILKRNKVSGVEYMKAY